MRKLLQLGFILLVVCQQALAQNIDEAKSFYYYGRTTSAKDVLNKMLASKPGNEDAIYWLGQVYLKEDNLEAAKKVYNDAAQAGNQSPLVEVGQGHVALLEGDSAKARQLFDDAIAKSTKRRKENPEVLAAVGRANADGSTSVGDPVYGIEKLKRAVELNPNDPDAYVNMGISYLKLGSDNGGNAYEAFMNALKIDPNYAAAKYRLGKIFLTQGNKEKFEGYFIGATESDPKYAPAYLDLYNYYAQRDVNKAKQYLESYMANSDKDCNVDFFYADYLFRAGDYQQSLDKGKAMANGACKDHPRLKILFAYDYDRLGDTALARENIDAFMAQTSPKKIQPDDYMLAASILKKIPGREDGAISYLKTALANDTVKANHFKYMDTIASLYKKLGDFDQRLEWLQKSYQANPNPSNLDIYNIGDAAYQSKNYKLADSMFNVYATKYPDQIYGFLGAAKAAIAADADTTAGSAIPQVTKLIEAAKRIDVQKNKSLIIQNYAYLVYVNANVLKDYEAALSNVEGILDVDPENAYAKQTAAQLKKVMAANSGKNTASSKK